MTISILVIIGKFSSEEGHPFLTNVCFNYEQLFHPVHWTASGICQFRSIDKMVLPEASGFLSKSDQHQCLWGRNYFGEGTQQNSTCVYQSWSVRILFYLCILYNIGKKLLRNQSLKCLAFVALQLKLVFREKFSLW